MPELSVHHLSTTKVVIVGRVTPDDDLSLCLAALSDGERARAADFRTRMLHDVYVATHGTLRHALSDVLGIPPAEIRFETNEWGKPLLCEPFKALNFNISHSHDHFAVGLSDEEPIGVDLERKSAEAPYEIAPHFMSSNEVRAFSSLSGESKHYLFYDLWVRKEAIVKALGMGLSLDLRQIDVLEWSTMTTPLGAALGHCRRPYRFLDIPRFPEFAAAAVLVSAEASASP
ncbi:4'-phosphopantetheinyl transferase superfamily protein [Rhizobium sp. FKL33]|uniref:4'-phosphopantetheinyl transferase family protein n=1 Tax=Rhizobium sp. FKL33 TaxID=2562307 RepID=UPI0010C13688|nr:4'-phosphopantetheinyl transferase superfamily protein [Rhizobium sp. FKL33]